MNLDQFLVTFNKTLIVKNLLMFTNLQFVSLAKMLLKCDKKLVEI